MNYNVTDKPIRICFGWFSVVFFVAFLALFVFMSFFTEIGALSDRSFTVFGCTFLTVIIAISVFNLHRTLHPRLKIRGSKLTYYPRWGRKVTLDISEITKRQTSSYLKNLYVGGGLAGYFTPGGRAGVDKEITYFCDGIETVVFHTGMVNAEKLDSMIRKQLGMEC